MVCLPCQCRLRVVHRQGTSPRTPTLACCKLENFQPSNGKRRLFLSWFGRAAVRAMHACRSRASADAETKKGRRPRGPALSPRCALGSEAELAQLVSHVGEERHQAGHLSHVVGLLRIDQLLGRGGLASLKLAHL